MSVSSGTRLVNEPRLGVEMVPPRLAIQPRDKGGSHDRGAGCFVIRHVMSAVTTYNGVWYFLVSTFIISALTQLDNLL